MDALVQDEIRELRKGMRQAKETGALQELSKMS
jgi:hypothetical protein